MSRKRLWLLVAVVLVVVLTFLFRNGLQPNPGVPGVGGTNASVGRPALGYAGNPSAVSSVGRSEPIRRGASLRGQPPTRDDQQELELWQSPLLYYGKVVDEKGVPIAGVQVSYGVNSLNDAREELYSTGTVATDGRGVFKVDGIRGVGLMLQLSHPRYYPYPDNSTGFDKRSVPISGYFSDTEQKAQLFRMHSKGRPVPLVFRQGGMHTPADGTSATFPLRGTTRAAIIGQGQIQGWKGTPDPQNDGRYDWKVSITVPSGGVLESTNYFEFVAPETGYQQTLEIGMPKDDSNWQSHLEKRLFFRFPNYFVRANVSVDMFHDCFFAMDYFVNPNGSANLEDDGSHPFQEP